ncbi:ornithine cyclodeaminase family protein [Tenggerimyces flavus]|uniref:Ornithine cyclodeaminase family protein n=1 Tax=Tenggerimyces flavus TaxID=1708749 RepID=A0ABV7Y4G6_9ACTN|nr:ornithine cyclodeaminase family protein [Tenggerimyces flavus]MBM7788268.1 ornithine cyclodeaminase [Tenggerimyces flavus]
MLVLSKADVQALLDIDALIDALAAAHVELSAGRVSMPSRVAATVPERDGFLAAMPAYLPSAGVLTSKLVALFPHNVDRPTHHAVIVAFDPATGEPAALLDGEVITAARTGAGSALSARLLAREDAEVLAILGTGVQARSHAIAVSRVRPIRELRVAGRDPAKAAKLAAELDDLLPQEVRAAETYREAMDGAAIVCATTHATDPVVRREWLSPGTHVTSVGFNRAGREVDEATVAEALVCVESRQAALAPFPAGSNELLQSGVQIHAELGELVAGTKPCRTAPDQLTLYKSVGVAVQDAAAAALVLAAAHQSGHGTEIGL